MKSLNEFVDQIYCINLDKDKSKLAYMELLAKSYNFKFRRMAAVDALTDSNAILEHSKACGIIPTDTSISNASGAELFKENSCATLPKKAVHKRELQFSIGCTMSHIECIKDAVANNYKNVIILEDDVLPHINFDEILDSFYIPKDYDFIYLGGNLAGPRKEMLNPIDEVFSKTDNIAGTYAYMINEKAFQKSIDILSDFTEFTDRSYGKLHKTAEVYILNKHVFLPNILDSNIRNYEDARIKEQWESMYFNYNDVHPMWMPSRLLEIITKKY
jgi:GR25 family glycosyltransferase involved in LPS biosynthesis